MASMTHPLRKMELLNHLFSIILNSGGTPFGSCIRKLIKTKLATNLFFHTYQYEDFYNQNIDPSTSDRYCVPSHVDAVIKNANLVWYHLVNFNHYHVETIERNCNDILEIRVSYKCTQDVITIKVHHMFPIHPTFSIDTFMLSNDNNFVPIGSGQNMPMFNMELLLTEMLKIEQKYVTLIDPFARSREVLELIKDEWCVCGVGLIASHVPATHDDDCYICLCAIDPASIQLITRCCRGIAHDACLQKWITLNQSSMGLNRCPRCNSNHFQLGPTDTRLLDILEKYRHDANVQGSI